MPSSHPSDRRIPPRAEAVASGPDAEDQRLAAKPIRVVVADDHPLAVAGIKALIRATGDMEVVGEAPDAESALQLIKRSAPDIAAIEVPMPGLTASALADYLAEHQCKTKILALTGQDDGAYLMELLQIGAQGYLLKRSAPMELAHAIRVLLSGRVYIDPAIASKLLIRAAPGDAISLSQRELAVLRLVARGYGNKEMAARLELSIKTVQTYKTRAMRKLRLRTRADVVRYGSTRGWIDEI